MGTHSAGPAPHQARPERPRFLITVDTEGDNLWARLREVTTENARFLPRFQALCEAYGLRPTYLTNYEMAVCPAFVEFGRDVLRRGQGEIGMHLHAWNSPPSHPLADGDEKAHPYLTQYPVQVMTEKVSFLTRVLEEAFGTRMVSHRAGRWGFDARYARMLADHGYRVDCSVTPHVSWQRDSGDPDPSRAPDYTNFPEQPYFLDLEDISRPGHSDLLEVPMTIRVFEAPPARWARSHLPEGSLCRRLTERFFRTRTWLRPNGRNLPEMRRLLKAVVERREGQAEFMLHSSEFMPGGSPTFPTHGDIERLYEHLSALFEQVREHFVGATLAEYRARAER